MAVPPQRVSAVLRGRQQPNQDSLMLLALDTATATASVALYDQDAHQLLAEYTWQADRRHTQDLLATAQWLLAQRDLTPAAVTALAVTTGPGSFTGVRIAISAAKGIGLGLPTPPPVVGLPTLSVTAAPWRALAAAQDPPPIVCAYLQAGRGRYNWTLFDTADPLWRPEAADHQGGDAAEFAQALAARPGQLWLVGEADAALAQAVAALPQVVMVDAVAGWRRAGYLAHLAAQRLAAGAGDDLKTLQPLYLRNP
jgi:tRNA threonylcarbamoyladenosine biosynthesis protein TsaB